MPPRERSQPSQPLVQSVTPGSTVSAHNDIVERSVSIVATEAPVAVEQPDLISQPSQSLESRRGSIEPPHTFVEGHHVGPNAGVSFLYWNRHEDQGKSRAQSEAGDLLTSTAPLTTYGDLANDLIPDGPSKQLTVGRIDILLETYFRFATPTYRYMHQASLEQWAKSYTEGRRLSVTQESCVLLACAQSLLYTRSGDRYTAGWDEDVKTSKSLCEKAKALLDRETGQPSVISVQARLALCLYLLGTFRMNECRYSFSFTATIVTSLGLHRRQSSHSSRLTLLDKETRRRTFWCVYVLDGYLSVMLGRPRLLRDEDIDQPYPQNISDADLVSSDVLEPTDLPLHGNLEAFIGHIDIAKLMGKNNDLLYPLNSLTQDVIVQRANQMLDALNDWVLTLPEFLKPRERTLTGARTFERQNTVLKLAHAHMRILATRRCLLADFSRLGKPALDIPFDQSSFRPIQECFHFTTVIIDAVTDLIGRGSLHQSFWFIQYITIVAISTLYVFRVQFGSHAMPGSFDTASVLQKAKKCQEYLSTLAPEGSQAKRHYQLLDRLRSKAEQPRGHAKARQTDTSGTTNQKGRVQPQDTMLATQSDPNPKRVWQSIPDTQADGPAEVSFLSNNEFQGECTSSQSAGQDSSIFDAQFTPMSEFDYNFQSAFNLGWESLDTIGFLSNDGGYHFESF